MKPETITLENFGRLSHEAHEFIAPGASDAHYAAVMAKHLQTVIENLEAAEALAEVGLLPLSDMARKEARKSINGAILCLALLSHRIGGNALTESFHALGLMMDPENFSPVTRQLVERIQQNLQRGKYGHDGRVAAAVERDTTQQEARDQDGRGTSDGDAREGEECNPSGTGNQHPA